MRIQTKTRGHVGCAGAHRWGFRVHALVFVGLWQWGFRVQALVFLGCGIGVFECRHRGFVWSRHWCFLWVAGLGFAELSAPAPMFFSGKKSGATQKNGKTPMREIALAKWQLLPNSAPLKRQLRVWLCCVYGVRKGATCASATMC